MAEPQHYTCSPASSTRRWWPEPHIRNHPDDVPWSLCTPTWSSLDFSGRSATRTKWEAMGTRQVRVTSARLRESYSSGPAYASVNLEGGVWWIGLGRTVTIPRQVATILTDAGYTVTDV